MKKPIRIAVMVIFISVLAAHVVVIPQIEIGLDQKLSMPEDSYVLKYFKVRKRENGTCFCCLLITEIANKLFAHRLETNQKQDIALIISIKLEHRVV